MRARSPTSIRRSGGTSGIYVARLFQQLGIASQMQAKSVLVHGGLAGQAVARGQAEIALQQASELRLVPSVKFAGLLPEASRTGPSIPARSAPRREARTPLSP